MLHKISKKWQKSFLLSYFFLTGWGAFWLLTWIFLIVEQPKTWGQTVKVPNFQQLTFSNLPPAGAAGSVQIPSNLQKQLNYDPNRSWQAGQSPTEFLKLGDFQDSFKLQQLSLTQIESLSGQSLSQVSLSQLGLIKNWSLGDLVTVLPGLKTAQINQIPLVKDLLSKQGYNISKVTQQTIGNLLKKVPNLPSIPLNSVNLSNYSLNSLPGLKNIPLSHLKGWGNATIAQIPGLASVPLSLFPNAPTANGGGIGQIDLVLSQVEQPALRTISGSQQQGFNANCSSQCAHVELVGNPLVDGKQWISGKYQQVEGGFGALKSLFGGKEPTGRHPFGNGFKVAIWDVDESTDTITTAWFFRICIRSPIDLGCSPYGIGPIPSFNYRSGDWVFLGP